MGVIEDNRREQLEGVDKALSAVNNIKNNSPLAVNDQETYDSLAMLSGARVDAITNHTAALKIVASALVAGVNADGLIVTILAYTP